MIMLTTLLVALAFATSVTAEERHDVDSTIAGTPSEAVYHEQRWTRSLMEDAPCNTQLGTIIRPSDVVEFTTLMFGSTFESLELPLSDLNATIDRLASTAQYDVNAHKVCGACADVSQFFDTQRDKSTTNLFGGFSDYCGPDTYGQDAIHSALVFLPVIPSGTVDGYLQMHQFTSSLTDAPSQIWPRNDPIQDVLQSVAELDATTRLTDFVALFSDIWTGLLVASTSGAVAIFPDGLGFGASRFTHNRTTFSDCYSQAAVVSYAAAGTYLQSTGDGCTVLGLRMAAAGASEGGYGVVPAAHSLSDFVEVTQVTVASGLLNLFQQLSFSIGQFDRGESSFLTNSVVARIAVPYFAFTLSNEIPGVANTGSGQFGLADAYRGLNTSVANAYEWFQGPDGISFLETFLSAPADVSATVNPRLVEIIRQSRAQGASGECPAELIVEGETDLLCEALEQGNYWDEISATELPLQLCWSDDDTLVGAENYPPFLLDNTNVSLYASTLASGDHLQAFLFCLTGAVIPFTEQAGHVIQPLSGPQLLVCESNETPVRPRCRRRTR